MYIYIYIYIYIYMCICNSIMQKLMVHAFCTWQVIIQCISRYSTMSPFFFHYFFLTFLRPCIDDTTVQIMKWTEKALDKKMTLSLEMLIDHFFLCSCIFLLRYFNISLVLEIANFFFLSSISFSLLLKVMTEFLSEITTVHFNFNVYQV